MESLLLCKDTMKVSIRVEETCLNMEQKQIAPSSKHPDTYNLGKKCWHILPDS